MTHTYVRRARSGRVPSTTLEILEDEPSLRVSEQRLVEAVLW